MLAMLLTLALLSTQWLGLSHRIDHAGLPAQQTAGWTAGAQDDGYGHALAHACELFDGAALGAALHMAPAGTAVLPGAETLALQLAFLSWNAPFLRHYATRAPPSC